MSRGRRADSVPIAPQVPFHAGSGALTRVASASKAARGACRSQPGPRPPLDRARYLTALAPCRRDPPRLHSTAMSGTDERERALGRRDNESGRELPGLGRADPRRRRALARPDQGRGRARERRPRVARPGPRPAHRRSGGPDRGGRVRRPVPDRRVPDRLWHELQHERQRGHRDARRRGRPRERPRQHGPVVERRLPVGRPPRGARPGRERPAPRARAARARARREGDGVRRRRQVRPDASDGRCPGHARPGVRGLRGAGAPGHRARSRMRSRGSARSRSEARPTGTGLNTHPDFAEKVRALLHEATGLPVSAPADPFEAQAARDGLVEASGALKVVAVSLTKIANDLRLMGSGPRAGLSELFLPELQKGSSIMPGKVNPVIPEVVTQVAAQVIGNDTAITIGGMNGHFELNVYVPLIARNLLESIGILASASAPAGREVRRGHRGEPRAERAATPSSTLSAATALNPYIGYDKASEIVKEAVVVGPLATRGRARGGCGGERPRRGARLPRDGQAARVVGGSTLGRAAGAAGTRARTRASDPRAPAAVPAAVMHASASSSRVAKRSRKPPFRPLRTRTSLRDVAGRLQAQRTTRARNDRCLRRRGTGPARRGASAPLPGRRCGDDAAHIASNDAAAIRMEAVSNAQRQSTRPVQLPYNALRRATTPDITRSRELDIAPRDRRECRAECVREDDTAFCCVCRSRFATRLARRVSLGRRSINSEIVARLAGQPRPGATSSRQRARESGSDHHPGGSR